MNLKLLFLPLVLIFSTQIASAVPSSFAYDQNNRVTQVNYADGRQATFTYDEVGNILTIVTRTVPAPVVLIESQVLGKVGAAIDDYQISVISSTALMSYSATGLPAGLKINKGTTPNLDGKGGGVIYGTPTVGGRFTVQLTAKNAVGTSAPASLIVEIANPFGDIEDGFSLATKVVGNINASAIAGGDLGGRIDLLVTKTGAFTGKVTMGGKIYSFKGSFNGETGGSGPIAIARLAPLPALTLNLTLDLADADRGAVSGTLSDGTIAGTAGIDAYASVWNIAHMPSDFTTPLGALYNVVLYPSPSFVGVSSVPQGSGYLQVKLDKLGTATITGKLANGTPVSASSFVWADGTLPLYVALYTSKGSLFGKLLLDDGFAFDTIADNIIAGTLAWSHPTVPGLVYPAAFDSTLDAVGGVYIAPLKGYRLLDLGNGITHPSVRFQLLDGGLTADIDTTITISTTNLVTFPVNNTHALKLTLTPTTGLFSGSVTDLPRKPVTIQGVIVPAFGSDPAFGAGYFLLPGAASGSQTLSGSVFFGKP